MVTVDQSQEAADGQADRATTDEERADWDRRQKTDRRGDGQDGEQGADRKQTTAGRRARADR